MEDDETATFFALSQKKLSCKAEKKNGKWCCKYISSKCLEICVTTVSTGLIYSNAKEQTKNWSMTTRIDAN